MGEEDSGDIDKLSQAGILSSETEQKPGWSGGTHLWRAVEVVP